MRSSPRSNDELAAARPGAGTGPRRLNEPRPVRVRTTAGGRPVAVDGRTVETVRETWLVEDRWWTARPLRRRYWEVVTTCGRDLVVFRELDTTHPPGWFAQR